MSPHNPPSPSRPFRIGYDASVTLAPGGGGIRRYVLELLRAMVANAPTDAEFVVLLNSRRRAPGPDHTFLFSHPQVRVVTTRWPGPAVVEGWRLAAMPRWEWLTGVPCDVVFSPAGYIPSARCPVVATVHDLAFLRETGPLPVLGGGHFKRLYPARLRTLRRIITHSEFVRQDVAKTYDFSVDRITVARPGLSEVFGDQPSLLERKNHVLALTGTVARKRAAWVLRPTLGGSACRVAGVASLAAKYPFVLPHLSDAALRDQYMGARLAVLPSAEEGFGFPVLEALACGTPVLCGQHSSLPEVGGGFARYADFQTAEDFESAVAEALAEPPPSDAWRAAASAHALGFTWERTANEVHSALRSAVAG